MTAETFNPTPTELKGIILAMLGGSHRNGHPDGILDEDLKTKVNKFVERVVDARITLSALELAVDEQVDFWINDNDELTLYSRKTS